MNDGAVRREARDIASDARKSRDLSDAEAETLRDLLRSDEAFGQLVTAQQAAVSVRAWDHAVDSETEELAHEGAAALGDAIDRVIDARINDAQAIVELTDSVDTDLPWGQASKLYQAGIEDIDDLRAADQAELIDAGAPRSLAARLKATVDGGRGQR
jgi:hypothetical protein